ncbi:MAG TPA: pseudouridine synthase [Polyangiaceae bacterium]|nr:pseudouridine synthase [Polyangiaceae bacterium]
MAAQLERLQKVLARAGVASRRAAERLIQQGRVSVGGKTVTELGTRVDPKQTEILIDGAPIAAQALVYVLLHKPRGVVCTMHDPEGRTTIVELVKDIPERVVPVGRLDYDTSGVLLLTNDGALAASLTHPRSGTAKKYVAKVRGVLGPLDLARFRESIEIDGRRTRPAEVHLMRHEGDKSWLQIVLREGKNRQIHRLGDHAGFGISRLARVSFAGITVGDLRPGQWRYLTAREVTSLKRIGASDPTNSVSNGGAPARAGAPRGIVGPKNTGQRTKR